MSEAQEIQVLDRQVRLLQTENGFRTGLDSVMLAAACPVQAGQRVLDMGCGVGGAGFCVLRRVEGAHLTGVDIQADHIDLARQNIELNNMQGRAEFICSDIRDYRSEMPFDHVICNPPYLEAGEHISSPSDAKARAMGHQDADLSLEDWVKAAFHNLKSNGSLTMIHRAEMVDKIIQALGKSYGATEMIPLWPKAGEPAKRVIIRTIKHRKSPSTIHPGIILHQDNGEYTKEADDILRGAASIV